MQSQVLYNLKTPNSNVYFLKDRFVYQFAQKNSKTFSDSALSKYENIEVKFINPLAKSFISEEFQLPSKTNYLIGNDKQNWITDIPNFQTLVYNEIYKGVNLKYYSKNNELKYDFIINPGADINDIKLEFNGQQNIELIDGKLEITTASKKLIENIPLAYQIINGKKVVVKVNYILQNNHVGFNCLSYDKSVPLIIDPILFYSTYIGGSGDDLFALGNLRKDNLGNIYATGYTYSANFPVTAGVYSSTFAGNTDVCVFKLNSTGTALIYSTFIGGSDLDRGMDLVLDTNTYEVYVCGDSFSTNFPTTTGVYQPANASIVPAAGADAFVLRLSATGNSLVFSTFVGGINDDKALALILDSQHNLWMTGESQSTSFPVTTGAYDVTWNGSFDCIIFKMNDLGTNLLYSTFLGGNVSEGGHAITIDSNADIYVGIHTQGGSFPTTAGAFDVTYNGGTYDYAFSKLNIATNTLVYSTYIGGTGDDWDRHDMHVDNAGNLLISGAASSGFPTTAGAYDQTFNGGNFDAYVAELNATGTALNFSTLFGSAGDDAAYMCYKNHNNNIVVTGYCSNNFPVTPCCYDPSYNGGASDAFITIFDATGSNLLYSTYIGGSLTDQGFALTCDYDTVYVSGQTGSSNFPTTAGAYDVTYNGGTWDLFILKIYLGLQPSVSNFSLTNASCSMGCTFTNLSTNATTYTWLFGDGGTSTLTNPTYTYTAAGQYTISLISDPGGSCADTSTNVIKINSSPTAQFSISQSNCNKTIGITNNSANATNNSWNFGDGTQSNSLNPLNHLYSSSGTYTITLIADTGGVCADTLRKVVTIPNPPTSNFSVVTATCSMNCTLVNSSIGATTYTWLFGDGNTSTLSNPLHSYGSAGQYTISLIANSSAGCADTSKQIINLSTAPQAQFSITPNYCTNSISVNNTSTNASNYVWNFGDGNQANTANATHTYSTFGTYNITLISSSNNGCSDTLKKSVTMQNIKPISAFTVTANGCVGNIPFTNNSINAQTYTWNFGDGSLSSTQFTPTHNYTTAGTYTAQLVVFNQTCNKYDTSYQTINVSPTPIVHLGRDTSICSSGNVAFNLNAGNPGATYQWSNGLTSQIIPVSLPGTYWVKVTTGACFNEDTIHIYSPYFTLGNDSTFCGKESIEITPRNLNFTPDNYLWSTGVNAPSITTTDEGMYWLQISEGTCKVRDTINVIGGYESSLLWMPNTFTPNDDQLNEIFKPLGTDITSFDMKIYNRWGEKIFETTDSNQGWNGMYKGQMAECATYVWLIHYSTSCSKNTIIKKSGQVTIIK